LSDEFHHRDEEEDEKGQELLQVDDQGVEEPELQGEGYDAPQEEAGAEEPDSEEPLYVNAKQFSRIIKRRAARQRLEELNRLARSRKVSRNYLDPRAKMLMRQPYLHESRHRHACNRPRGKGGRFLTAEEIEALKKEEAAKSGGVSGEETPDGSRPSTVG
jgi:hypothetical protein